MTDYLNVLTNGTAPNHLVIDGEQNAVCGHRFRKNASVTVFTVRQDGFAPGVLHQCTGCLAFIRPPVSLTKDVRYSVTFVRRMPTRIERGTRVVQIIAGYTTREDIPRILDMRDHGYVTGNTTILSAYAL